MSLDADLEAILGPDGLLARLDEGYEDRPQQREMARRVADALEARHHLVVEAGTGTGKTLAYLVPAVLSGQRVVVSTATRALQEQVFGKDLPFLGEALGLPFRAAVLKGRGNYLCLLRKNRFDEQPTFVRREEGDLYPLVEAWARTTETGDRAELAEVPEGFSAWPEIVSSTDTCIGQKCDYYQDCFVVRARARAAEAEVVVVNHHLFFADLALRTSEAGALAGAEVIPGYQAVIFDEAHAIEEIATGFFGVTVSSYRVRDLCRDAGRLAAARPELARQLGEVAARLERHSREFFEALELPDGRSRLTSAVFARAEAPQERLLETLGLMSAVTAVEAASDEEVASLERRSREIGATLLLLAEASDPASVYWAEVRGRGVFLRSSPIDVSGELRDRLLRRVDSCTFTSATLSTGGSLDYFRSRIGLVDADKEVFDQHAVILPSPFDYERQAALYVPRHLPTPDAPGFPDAVADQVVELCRLSGGRAFVLCTSHRNMRAIHERLEGRLEWPLLLQGEAPKGALLEEFRSEPSVLVATQSFWEGVDVPGEALSLVVIDKLPFASPGDPVVAARLDHLRGLGGSPFGQLQLPEAALALKQGFGRLIRTRRDRGIVAVCDVRLATRSYRGHFFRTLPPCPRFRDLPALEDWWREGGGSPTFDPASSGGTHDRCS